MEFVVLMEFHVEVRRAHHEMWAVEADSEESARRIADSLASSTVIQRDNDADYRVMFVCPAPVKIVGQQDGEAILE